MVIYWRDTDRKDFGDWDTADSPQAIIVEDTPHSERAFKCRVLEPQRDRRCELARWTDIKYLEEAYFGAWLYLSPGFEIESWGGILQLKGMVPTGSHERKFFLKIDPETGILNFVKDFRGPYYPEDPEEGPKIGPGSQGIWWREPVWESSFRAPRSTWFHFAAGTKLKKEGVIEAYYNGKFMASLEGDHRMVPYNSAKGVHLRTGLYASTSQTTPNYVIVDNAICASTLEEVLGDLAPPPPPIVKRGCVLAFLCSSMGLSIVLPSIRQLRSRLPKSIVSLYYSLSGLLLKGIGGGYGRSTMV